MSVCVCRNSSSVDWSLLRNFGTAGSILDLVDRAQKRKGGKVTPGGTPDAKCHACGHYKYQHGQSTQPQEHVVLLVISLFILGKVICIYKFNGGKEHSRSRV